MSNRDFTKPEPSSPQIYADGEMAELFRQKDWSETPLGALENWSETLISVVNFLLNYPFSFCVFWGPQRTVLYNDTYRTFLYGKHPWALGLPAEEVWGEAWEQVGPEIDAAYCGEKTVYDEALIPILGSEGMEDHWFTYGLYPIFEGNRIAGVANPGRNVSEAVRARLALVRSEARIAQVLEATQDAIVTVNRDWKFTYVNHKAEQMYGTGLLGRSAWEAFPEVVYEGSPFVKYAYQAMDQGIPGHFEEHYPEPLNLTLDLDVHPNPDGIIVFSRDVSERKRTMAALVQNEKLAAVGRLASSIAHEINNPLEAVTNLLYLAKANAEPGPVQEYLDLAERELRRVSAISNQTLRFNKQSTRPTVVTCYDLFAEALSIYQGRLVNSRITVEKRKRAKQPAECFEGEIRQVLSNFMSNAVDAMQVEGGRLILRSREAKNWKTGERGLVLTVADSGPACRRISKGRSSTRSIQPRESAVPAWAFGSVRILQNGTKESFASVVHKEQIVTGLSLTSSFHLKRLHEFSAENHDFR